MGLGWEIMKSVLDMLHLRAPQPIDLELSGMCLNIWFWIKDINLEV